MKRGTMWLVSRHGLALAEDCFAYNAWRLVYDCVCSGIEDTRVSCCTQGIGKVEFDRLHLEAGGPAALNIIRHAGVWAAGSGSEFDNRRGGDNA